MITLDPYNYALVKQDQHWAFLTCKPMKAHLSMRKKGRHGKLKNQGTGKKSLD